MKNFSTEQRLVFLCITLFFVSAVFLFWQNGRQLDPDQGKNWWALSFDDPHDMHSLSFTIENHSASTYFQYDILQNKQVLQTTSITVSPGESKSVPVTTPGGSERTTIRVSDGVHVKEIYR